MHFSDTFQCSIFFAPFVISYSLNLLLQCAKCFILDVKPKLACCCLTWFSSQSFQQLCTGQVEFFFSNCKPGFGVSRAHSKINHVIFSSFLVIQYKRFLKSREKYRGVTYWLCVLIISYVPHFNEQNLEAF